jgi:hypothetical protein
MAEPLDLVEALAGFSRDPVGWVYFAFPWGQTGTDLETRTGPYDWQLVILRDLAAGLLTINEAIRLARTSGHGIGKSALVAWIVLWAISTFEDTKGVVTANTENQLKTKTWAEVAKWHRLFIGRELFEFAATALYSKDPLHEKTWRIDMVPWSERNTEAFAGLHNSYKRILIIIDEASAVPDVIWEVIEGALTDLGTEIIFCVFGNPTRNKGRFRECFSGGKFAHRWKSAAIDSRTVPGTNLSLFTQWVDDYGEDSDFVRVRVRGVFPRQDAVSFISYEVATNASVREPPDRTNEPVILGVDVARFGDDASVIYPRAGRDGRSRPIEIFYKMDTMALAAKVVAAANRYKAGAVMIDGGGVGGGVVDRCRQLGLNVFEVDFGSGPDGTNPDDTGTKYFNKRAEIWGALRSWLEGGSIAAEMPGTEVTLIDELTGPTYSMSGKEEIQLESKKDMRRRGVASPNVADALACTFAFPVFHTQADDFGDLLAQMYGNVQRPDATTLMSDFDPLSREAMQ